MGAWTPAGWRVWDLGNGTIMLQKFFNREWQITSKSFLLSSFLIGFSFPPTAEISSLELEFEQSLPRKTALKRGLDRSQMEQPIKKNKFSYFARSRLRLRPQEIWERDYEEKSKRIWMKFVARASNARVFKPGSIKKFIRDCSKIVVKVTVVIFVKTTSAWNRGNKKYANFLTPLAPGA